MKETTGATKYYPMRRCLNCFYITESTQKRCRQCGYLFIGEATEKEKLAHNNKIMKLQEIKEQEAK